jgi:hypothetical protein
MQTLDFKLILQLSLFGLLMAVATVFVIPSNIEPAFWLVIFGVCAWVIARRCSAKHFLHGFLVSLANCVWITTLHILLFDSYIERHPQEAAMMKSMPLPDSPRLMMLMTGPVIGVISGVVLGLFAFIASKIVKPVAA